MDVEPCEDSEGMGSPFSFLSWYKFALWAERVPNPREGLGIPKTKSPRNTKGERKGYVPGLGT